LKIPSFSQIHSILKLCLPPFLTFQTELQQKIHEYIQGDLRKLLFLCQIWKKKPELLKFETIQDIFHVKMFNEDAKKITWRLINNPIPLEDHTLFMNETDRTTVALLWHENIANPLSLEPKCKALPFYSELLENICFADYIGRITFQSQIWQFNEMGSLIKTFYNNRLYHNTFPNHSGKFALSDVDFTKVLTKYSTEYNNQLFLYGLCQKMNMDKNDLVAFFQELRVLYSTSSFLSNKSLKYNKHTNTEWMMNVEEYLAKDNVDLLDIKRMYRFLDKNVKKEDDVDYDEMDIDNDEDSEYGEENDI
jgi:hypothetical protein